MEYNLKITQLYERLNIYTTTITQLTKELLRDNTIIKRKQVKTDGKINELRGGGGPEKKYNPFPILSLTSAKE